MNLAGFSFALAPQAVLAAGAIGALFLGALRRDSAQLLRLLRTGTLLAALALLALSAPGEAGPLIRLDGRGLAWQFLVYAGALPFALLVRSDDEVVTALFLGSVLGMGLLAASSSLLMLFIALEFMSLPAYVLVARGRKGAALEAGLKYFFAGGTAGAIFLMGMTLYYAESKSFGLSGASGLLGEGGVLLMGAAALFKLGAVPLHFWLPDVYEAAEPELAGFFSTSLKSAAALLLLRITALSPSSAFAASLPAAGALTMLAGSLMALRQQNLQRLLAYSSIAHAGNIILGVGAWAALGAEPAATVSVLFYLLATIFMSNGVFAFVKASGVADRAGLKGLARREPVLAALFSVLLLALAGVPPTGGFLAKLLIFWDAIKARLYAPVVVGALAALIALGYYLALMREMYFEEPAAGESAEPPARRTAVLWACAVPAALLGLAPWILGSLAGVLSL